MWNTYNIYFYSADYNQNRMMIIDANSANEAEVKALVQADLWQWNLSFIIVKIERITNNTEESI